MMMPTASIVRRHAAAAIWVAAACAAALVGEGAAAARDWSEVQLAWRDDPRVPADVPAGVESPQGRRPSRRAVRRATRRGQPLDRAPIESRRISPGPPLGDVSDPPAGPPPLSGAERGPRGVEATLASPFEHDRTSADGVTTHRDQPYGSRGDGRQKFDLHLPAGCNAGPLPLVVWIHGTDWRTGSKADCPVLWLVGQGYAVASVGYRLSDGALFPAQLDDCRAAIATLQRDAELWGIDPDRICVVGNAAGGHLAALVGFAAPADAVPSSGDDDQPRAAEHRAVAAVCVVGAPTHLSSLGPAHDRAASAASRLIGGPLPEFREAAQRASPLEHVSPDDPPTLIVHGARDTIIPSDQAVRLDRSLTAAGIDSTLVLLDADGSAPSLAQDSVAGMALRNFLDRVLGPGPRHETTPAAPR